MITALDHIAIAEVRDLYRAVGGRGKVHLRDRGRRRLLVSDGRSSPVGSSQRIVRLRHCPRYTARVGMADFHFRAGVLAQTMAGFIKWLARDRSAHQAFCRARSVRLRSAATGPGQHKRTPGIVGERPRVKAALLTAASKIAGAHLPT